MTLTEFRVHRPILSRALDRILTEAVYDGNPWAYEWQVHARYADGIRFVASCGGAELLVCVAPGHPMFNEADGDGPGCRGTWWWAEDLR